MAKPNLKNYTYYFFFFLEAQYYKISEYVRKKKRKNTNLVHHSVPLTLIVTIRRLFVCCATLTRNTVTLRSATCPKLERPVTADGVFFFFFLVSLRFNRTICMQRLFFFFLLHSIRRMTTTLLIKATRYYNIYIYNTRY